MHSNQKRKLNFLTGIHYALAVRKTCTRKTLKYDARRDFRRPEIQRSTLEVQGKFEILFPKKTLFLP